MVRWAAVLLLHLLALLLATVVIVLVNVSVVTHPNSQKCNHVQGILSSVFLAPLSSLRCCDPDAAACAVTENHKDLLNLAGF